MITHPPLTFEQVMIIMDKQKAETFAKIEADKKEHKERMDDLSRRFGDLGNRLGEIIEFMVITGIEEKFEKYGFAFGDTIQGLKIKNGKKTVTDIDFLLLDGDSIIMVIEVKTKPTLNDVERHIQRMDEILQYPNKVTKDVKIYGAIACALIEDDVQQAAFDAGFYVIMQQNENADIVKPPDNFIPKFWEVKNV